MSVTLATGANLGRVAEILRNAILLGPDAWQGNGSERTSSPPNKLPSDRDVVELFRVLAQRETAYLLVGGIAMLKYVEGRNTEDIDLLMSLPSLRAIPEIVIEEENEFFARGRFQSVRVDVLLTANALFAEVQKMFETTHRFGDIDVKTATPEGLILLKLYALPSLYRQGKFDRVSVYESDIASLLHRHPQKKDALIERLKPHMIGSDIREIQKIVEEIEARIARFEKFKS